MSSKPHAINAKDRTSQAVRVSALKRTNHLAALVQPGRSDFHDRRVDVWKFLTSDDVMHGLVAMTPMDRLITWISVIGATQSFSDSALIPPQAADYAARVRWDDQAIAELRAIAAKYGARSGLDRELARRMKIPLRAATQARYRFIGRVCAAREPYRKRSRWGASGRDALGPPTAIGARDAC